MSDLAYIDILNIKQRLSESYDNIAMDNKHLISEGFNEEIGRASCRERVSPRV